MHPRAEALIRRLEVRIGALVGQIEAQGLQLEQAAAEIRALKSESEAYRLERDQALAETEEPVEA